MGVRPITTYFIHIQDKSKIIFTRFDTWYWILVQTKNLHFFLLKYKMSPLVHKWESEIHGGWVPFRHKCLPSQPQHIRLFKLVVLCCGMKGPQNHVLCNFPLQIKAISLVRRWYWLDFRLKPWRAFLHWVRFQSTGPGPEANRAANGSISLVRKPL